MVEEAERLLTELAARAKRARLKRKEREYPTWDEVRSAIEGLVREYAAGDEPRRARARDFASASFDVGTWLLWGAGNCARELESAAPAAREERLESGLLALSIEDKRLDVRDTCLALGILWHRALRHGLDPRPCCERVAACSSSGAQGFAAFLRGFEASAFYRADVEPHLARAALAYEADAEASPS